MKTILSYTIFCLSFALFIYCLMLGPEADRWLMISALSFSVFGLVLDMVTYKNKT
jgi:hypothetical protein